MSIPIWVTAMLVTGTPVADGDVQASPPAELIMAGTLQPFSTVSLIAPETAGLVAPDAAMV